MWDECARRLPSHKRPNRGGKEEAGRNSTERGAREEGKAGWIEYRVSGRGLVLKYHGIFFRYFWCTRCRNPSLLFTTLKSGDAICIAFNKRRDT